MRGKAFRKISTRSPLNERVRGHLHFPNECVIHCLSHTFLTRFGEAGADAFTIKKVAGDSGVRI